MKLKERSFNPCKRCFLQGLCDRDECGRHLFELDTNKAPKFKTI